MKTAIPLRVGLLHLLLLYAVQTMAQTAPYAVPPKWMFGYRAGLDFTGGAPVVLAGNPSTNSVTDLALENSTSICEPSKNLAFYSNAIEIYNGATNATVRDMFTVNNIAGNSATGGCIAIPDPAAPATQFYLFIANDLSFGKSPSRGINYYKLTKTGTTVTVTAGPTLLAGTAPSVVDESLAAGTDGVGGYWIVSHEMGNNYFWVWHVTAAGVSAVDKQAHSPYVGGTGQGTVKFSKCQDRIAWTGNNSVVAYNWNRTTGKIDNSAALYSNVLGMGATGTEPTYGLEFSPDGTKIYHTILGNQNTTPGVLKQINIATGTLTTVDGTGSSNGGSKELGTMQLGPDNRIYLSEVSSYSTATNYIGVIGSPNNTIAAGVGYNKSGFTLKPANAASEPSTYRGLINLAWMSPNTPVINNTGLCTVDFYFDFQTYYLDNITVNTSSIRWDFNYNGTTPAYETAYNGDPTPTFDYSTLGNGSQNYTVYLTFKDQTCGHDWVATKTISTNCPLPVKWSNITARRIAAGNEINWGTYSEENNNYFVVQRSLDGVTFSDIARVAAGGNSQSAQQYQYLDAAFIAEEVVYYRILQVDIDGKSGYSKVITLSGEQASLRVYPNPSSGQFEVELSGAGDAQINITDITGHIVYSTTASGDYVHTRLGEELSKGTYLLTVTTSEGILREKLVKE